ncbi:hypothetical protein [Heyndrickxia oleronia]|uniref:hypothetical protein n=1 Tax=Heyndrickxia oleronia TaxID=38875 RepID=UPI001B2C6410|nr:hypothetical protein [Heyndrickxia oleronia]GIN41173.1 hypothetical protein J19TS1_41220 [Heyndrickxia oleronia]
MVNKTTQKERITLLLGLDVNNENYDQNIDTLLKRYKKVKIELAFEGETEADLIFQWLNNKNTNLKSLTAKNRAKGEFEGDLNEVLQLQRKYYEKEIYPTIFETACNSFRSLSDVDINLKENEYQYSLPLSGSSKKISELDIVLNKVIENNIELNDYINRTLKLIFIHYYEDPIEILKIRQFEEVVNESIEFYNKVKAKKKATCFNQTKNPYIKLYQYMRKAYINNYYNLLLPDMSYFSGCSDIGVKFETKSVYGLRDVAFVLSVLTTGINTPSEQILDKNYEKLKKSFQKYKHIQTYKVKNQYEFPNVVIPIAHYIFLSKKSNQKNGINNLDCSNEIIENRIQPILQAYLKGESDRLKTVFLYIKFLSDEFQEIMESYDHRYQITMIDFWFETIVNIFYRTMGLKRESVYIRY